MEEANSKTGKDGNLHNMKKIETWHISEDVQVEKGVCSIVNNYTI